MFYVDTALFFNGNLKANRFKLNVWLDQCDKEFQMITNFNIQFCKNFLVLSLTTSSLIMMGCQKGSNSTQDASTSFSREFSSLSENVSATEAFQIPGDFVIPGDNQSCSFNNQEILDGGSVTAYVNSTVTFGGSCQSETRTCMNGVLSGSNQYASCAVDAPASCLFNGETISHGQSLTTYLNSNVVFGGSCQSEMRTCENGSLSGSSQYASCEVAAPASCLFNGQTIVHSQSAVAFATSTVGFGESCLQESRTCTNGALSGSNQYASCEVAAPASCLFNGQTIVHSQSAVAFATSTVGFGESCLQESRICTNGALSGSSQYASCEVAAPASCLFNGQTITHGQNVMGYLAPSVDAGSACKQEVRTCANGSLSGSYFFQSCVVEEQEPTPLPEVTDPTTPPASSTPTTSSTPTVSETPTPTDEQPTTPVTPTPTTSSTPGVSQPTTPPVVTPSTSSTPCVSYPTTPKPPVVVPPKEDCKDKHHKDCKHKKDCKDKKHEDCKKKKDDCKDKEVKKDDCKKKKKDCKDKDRNKKDCKDKKKDCDKSKKEKKAHEHKHNNKPCDHEHKHQKDRPCDLKD